jgi:hypothetical protein
VTGGTKSVFSALRLSSDPDAPLLYVSLSERFPPASVASHLRFGSRDRCSFTEKACISESRSSTRFKKWIQDSEGGDEIGRCIQRSADRSFRRRTDFHIDPETGRENLSGRPVFSFKERIIDPAMQKQSRVRPPSYGRGTDHKARGGSRRHQNQFENTPEGQDILVERVQYC